MSERACLPACSPVSVKRVESGLLFMFLVTLPPLYSISFYYCLIPKEHSPSWENLTSLQALP